MILEIKVTRKTDKGIIVEESHFQEIPNLPEGEILVVDVIPQKNPKAKACPDSCLCQKDNFQSASELLAVSELLSEARKSWSTSHTALQDFIWLLTRYCDSKQKIQEMKTALLKKKNEQKETKEKKEAASIPVVPTVPTVPDASKNPRDSKGRFLPRQPVASGRPTSRPKKPSAQVSPSPTPTRPKRDSRGRFVSTKKK